VIIGGLEASLRRFPYYDYWTDQVKRSILFDAKADLLVYGMAERAIVDVARRLDRGLPLRGIRGTAEIRPMSPSTHPQPLQGGEQEEEALQEGASSPSPGPHLGGVRGGSGQGITPDGICELPPYEELAAPTPEGKSAFNRMTREVLTPRAPGETPTFTQRHGNRWLVVNPPAPPLDTAELDALYALPFTRRPHPAYGSARIPAWDMIKDSITIHRGCYGGCSFCAIASHQGRAITSRSRASVLAEVAARAQAPDFHGTLTDLGGPTANMYGTACRRGWEKCRRPSCLVPAVCPNLDADHSALLGLLRAARAVPGVRHAFVGSGIRFDLALHPAARGYVRELVRHHVSGRLKIAPEHVSESVLRHMRKPAAGLHREFCRAFADEARAAGKPLQLVEYFISGHPGCTLADMVELALYLRRHGIEPEQVQDFYPAPLTAAAAMFYTGQDPFTGEEVHVARSDREKALQRALLLCHQPEFHAKAREALREAGRDDLIGRGPGCLVP
jgi:uncharacterized radical SAM protein YgiQ